VSTVAAALLATSMKLVASHAAYPGGAPPGFSGGFKEESCHACHFHQPLNAAPGKITIDGVPARYAPGARYVITVTLTRSDMKRAGFQLAARFKDGGGQAGSLAPGNSDVSRVSIGRDGTVQYANQNGAGSVVAEPGIARWTVEWIAPAAGGPVVIHVAANAADGNESADGDYIYTASADIVPP